MPRITVTINGTAFEDEVEPRLLLVHYIRENARLKGAHVGCDTGNCGACTVLLHGTDNIQGSRAYRSELAKLYVVRAIRAAS